MSGLRPAKQRHCYRHLGRADNIPTGYRDAVRLRALPQSGVERVYVLHIGLRRQRQGDQRERRLSAHRADVANVDGERLPADIGPRSSVREKVHAFDHRVRRRNDVAVAASPDSGIVADADDEVVGRLRA